MPFSLQVPAGAAIAAALGGQSCAIIAWLVHAKVAYGALNLTTTQNLPPTMVRVRPCLIRPDMTSDGRALLGCHTPVKTFVDVMCHARGPPACRPPFMLATWLLQRLLQWLDCSHACRHADVAPHSTRPALRCMHVRMQGL